MTQENDRAMAEINKNLTREKNYETDVRSDDEYADLPDKVRFSISDVDAREIVRLAAVVKENNVYQIVKFDYRGSWLKEDDSDELQEVDVDV